MDLALATLEAARDLPAAERFGLKDQMRRAAVSIPANIAEGHSRTGRKDFRRFVCIAQGSRNELETYLLLAGRSGMLPASQISRLLGMSGRVGQMLTALRKAL